MENSSALHLVSINNQHMFCFVTDTAANPKDVLNAVKEFYPATSAESVATMGGISQGRIKEVIADTVETNRIADVKVGDYEGTKLDMSIFEMWDFQSRCENALRE